MKLVLKIVTISMLLFLTSSDPFYGSFSLLNAPIISETSDIKESLWINNQSVDKILSDFDNRVTESFKISPYFYNSVKFWFLIYTQFNSDHVVLHDKDNLNLIYTILDFRSLAKKTPKNTKYFLFQKLTSEKIANLKKQLILLSKSPNENSEFSSKILTSIKMAGINIPSSNKDRSSFYLKLSQSIRSQTGQQNFIRDGVMRSIPFENFLYDYFSKKNLPRELLAIPFLESSFNPVAQSKVNALGAWQFMPFISKHFVPKRRDNIDYRRSIGVSSISAAFLMEQNFKILKSWDLAVTAYNSGTKNILNTKKNLKKDRISLVDIIENGKSKSFGFASKNFYSEFLALVHTLAYRDEIFLIPNFESELLENDLHFFISKCDAKLIHILKPYELEEIDSYNHHFYDFHKILHKGLIISSKLNLSKKYFFKLSNEQILKFKPIEWPKLVRNYNCSTK